MRKLISICLLLCPLLAFSQGFTPRRPYVLTSASTGGNTNQEPQNLPGLYLWWHYGDALAQGTNVTMTNWLDRIQQWVFTNETALTRTTATTNGVSFNGSDQFMTNVIPVDMNAGIGSGHSLIFVVMNWIPSGVTPVYLSYDDGSATQQRRLFSSSRAWAIAYSPPALGCNIVSPVPTNVLMSLSTLNYTGGEKAYTNGVYAADSCGGYQRFNYVGFTPGYWYWQGYIRDIICYTNQADPTFVTNLQYWASTNYGMPYYP